MASWYDSSSPSDEQAIIARETTRLITAAAAELYCFCLAFVARIARQKINQLTGMKGRGVTVALGKVPASESWVILKTLVSTDLAYSL